jgi:hypothetical protein
MSNPSRHNSSSFDLSSDARAQFDLDLTAHFTYAICLALTRVDKLRQTALLLHTLDIEVAIDSYSSN